MTDEQGTVYSAPQRRSRAPLLIGLAGCVVLLCLGVVAAGAWWFFLRPARAVTGSQEPAVEYILDASPRMGQSAEGGTRLTVARGVLAEIVRPANADVLAGLRVFGTGAISDACRDTRVVVPLGLRTQARISDELAAVQAGAAADAAMAEAMMQAIRELADKKGPHTLVVVTGGADTCSPEAGQLIASEAEKADIALQMFVVGYQVADEDSTAIKDLVDETGAGTYLEAADGAELEAILAAIQTYVDSQGGVAVADVVATATAGGGAVVTGLGTPAATEAGSGGGAAATTAAPTEAPTQAGGGDNLGGGTGDYQSQTACDHPYFPLREGATWNYSSEYGTQTWEVTGVSGDLDNATAVMTISSADFSMTLNWTCNADGIVSYEFGSMSVAGGGPMPAFEVTDKSGAWLPPPDELREGASWTNNYTMNISTGVEGVAMNFSNSVAESYTAAARESLEVAGETLDALRVEGTNSSTMTVPGAGPTSFSSNVTYWLAKGVGLVRSQYDGEGMSSTTELTSYSIPGD